MTENIEDTLKKTRMEILKIINSPEYKKLNGFYKKKSLWEILKISRDENKHSDFLAWLLNPNESHGLGDSVLKQFCQCIVYSLMYPINAQWNSSLLDKEFLNAITTGTVKFYNVTVEREFFLLNEKENGRFDILIKGFSHWTYGENSHECPIQIILENKILSHENLGQTNKYKEWAERNMQKGMQTILIFLSPDPYLEIPNCECKDFIQINYQTLLETVLQPILKKTDLEHTKFLIEEYIRTLSSPAYNSDFKDTRKDIIMAIPQEEKELLTEFFTKNEDFFRKILSALSQDKSQTDETKAMANGLLTSLSAEHDYSTYDLIIPNKEIKKDLNKGTLALWVVRTILESNISSEEFDILSSYKVGSYNLLNTESEISTRMSQSRSVSPRRLYSKESVRYSEVDYFVTTEWTKERTEKFIAFLEKKFPKIKIKPSQNNK